MGNSMSSKQDDYETLRWFERLLAELARVPDERGFIGPRARWSGRPFDVFDWDPPGSGWFSTVATAKGGAQIQVWLDRYVNRGGDPHLGVWLRAPYAKAQQVARVLGEMPVYTWADRDDDGLLATAAARNELGRIGEFVFDDWRPTSSAVWVGAYVKASPHREPAADSVGHVLSMIRQLASATASPAPPIRVPTSRYWKIVRALARPNQAQFRALLLARHSACVVTGCEEHVLLDAAHIVSIREHEVEDLSADSADNGLLLRADVHRLFDADLLTITEDRRSLVQLIQPVPGYDHLHGFRVMGLTSGQRANLRRRNDALRQAGWLA